MEYFNSFMLRLSNLDEMNKISFKNTTNKPTDDKTEYSKDSLPIKNVKLYNLKLPYGRTVDLHSLTYQLSPYIQRRNNTNFTFSENGAEGGFSSSLYVYGVTVIHVPDSQEKGKKI